MYYPLITIVIPTYNRAGSYLKNALQSAISQTYQKVEIIVSDNCSADNTEEVVKSYNDPRIRYFRQSRNIGMTNNIMFCLAQTKGDYFLLLNDDDMIDSDFGDICMKSVKYDAGIGVILTGARVINQEGIVISEDTNKAKGLSIADLFLAWFEYKVPFYDCSTLYNTNGLREIGGFCSKKGLYDDNVALVQLAAKYGRLDIQEVKATFRRHNNNFGDNIAKITDWCEDSLYLLDVMCGLVPEVQDYIRHRGLLYFSVQNYLRSDRIKSPLKRLYAYCVVYKEFKYSYSPIQYMHSKKIFKNKLHRLLKTGKKRKIK